MLTANLGRSGGWGSVDGVGGRSLCRQAPSGRGRCHALGVLGDHPRLHPARSLHEHRLPRRWRGCSCV